MTYNFLISNNIIKGPIQGITKLKNPKDLIKILDKTKYGSDGMGGIITKGTMYIGYPR